MWLRVVIATLATAATLACTTLGWLAFRNLLGNYHDSRPVTYIMLTAMWWSLGTLAAVSAVGVYRGFRR